VWLAKVGRMKRLGLLPPLLAALTLLVIAASASAREQRLNIDDAGGSGFPVAIQGDTAVVESPGEGDSTGAVIVFHRAAPTAPGSGS
jgi:hypothetical protein